MIKFFYRHPILTAILLVFLFLLGIIAYWNIVHKNADDVYCHLTRERFSEEENLLFGWPVILGYAKRDVISRHSNLLEIYDGNIDSIFPKTYENLKKVDPNCCVLDERAYFLTTKILSKGKEIRMAAYNHRTEHYFLTGLIYLDGCGGIADIPSITILPFQPSK